MRDAGRRFARRQAVCREAALDFRRSWGELLGGTIKRTTVPALALLLLSQTVELP
jgi:hypothetical protein